MGGKTSGKVITEETTLEKDYMNSHHAHDMLTQNLTLKLPREKRIGTRELKAKQKLWERKPMILKAMISLSAVKLVQYCIPL